MNKSTFALVELTRDMGNTNTDVLLMRGSRVALRHRDALVLVTAGVARVERFDWNEHILDGVTRFPSFFECSLSGKTERMMVHLVSSGSPDPKRQDG